MIKVTPFLMFEGKAEEAMTLYCETIPGSSVVDVTRYGAGEDGPQGMLKLARVSIAGLEVTVYNSPVHHAFTFTPSVSLYVDCSSEQELNAIVEVLAKDGGVPDAAGQLRLQPPVRLAERPVRRLLADQSAITALGPRGPAAPDTEPAMTPGITGGINIAMKVPPHQFEATVAFYRDVIGLKPFTAKAPAIGFELGPIRLWIDEAPMLSQAEVWLELFTDDFAAAVAPRRSRRRALRCHRTVGGGFPWWLDHQSRQHYSHGA